MKYHAIPARIIVKPVAAQPGKGRPSTYSDEWYTPPKLVAALGAFDLDPCAGPMQHAAENWRAPIDGLTRAWTGRVWLNPPYSDVPKWLAKFADHGNGVALVNARPDAKWFQGFVAGATAVMWLCGRVEFGRPDGTHGHPPVGSVLIAYGRENATRLTRSGLRGVAMHLSPSELLGATLRIQEFANMTFDEMKELLASLAWYDASAYHHENVTRILKNAYPENDFSLALRNFEKCVTMKPCEGNPR